MMVRISKETVNSDFVRQVETISDQQLLSCNQCGKCSAGCPVVHGMDLLPNQAIRLIQLGIEDVLASTTIWTCASCLTCMARCPKGLDLSKVMEALRVIQLEKGPDHLRACDIPAELLAELPQLAIIGGLRKYSQ